VRSHPWISLAVALAVFVPWWLAYFAAVLRFTKVVSFWVPLQ
jgi:hypothetical protein